MSGSICSGDKIYVGMIVRLCHALASLSVDVMNTIT
jgi:hypothetical protein